MKSSGIQTETGICDVSLRKLVLSTSRIQIVILLR